MRALRHPSSASTIRSRYVDGVPRGDEITLRQLARMQSGLYNYTATEQFDQALRADPHRHFVPQELLDWAFARPEVFFPGYPLSGYGLGMNDNGGWIGHGGALPGYETVIGYLPERQTTLVILINTAIPYKGQSRGHVASVASAIAKSIAPQHVMLTN
jgi:CubicO group peptidase (beta-lactamase class C family)